LEVTLEDDRIFQPGRQVRLTKDSTKRQTEIEYFRWQHGRAVIKLSAIESIDDAERMVGAELSIPASEITPLDEGSFYTFQLKGCRVFAAGASGDEYLGVVTDVLDAGGREILKVDHEKKELLIPFAKSFLKKIDLAGQRIDVELPDGLRELNT